MSSVVKKVELFVYSNSLSNLKKNFIWRKSKVLSEKSMLLDKPKYILLWEEDFCWKLIQTDRT